MSSRRWRSGGQLDLHLRDAEVEVAPEAARVHGAHEVAARRGEDAHVDLAVGRAADGLDAALGERAEELGLHVERQLAQLVEEDGAAVRLLERGEAPVDRAREGAALVAEEGGLGERRRDRAAVDDDEGLARAGAGDWWIAWATSSLPVPVSPVMSRVRSVGATLVRRSKMARIERAARDHRAERGDRGDGDALGPDGLEEQLRLADAELERGGRGRPRRSGRRRPRCRCGCPCRARCTPARWPPAPRAPCSPSRRRAPAVQAALRPTKTGSVPISTQAAAGGRLGGPDAAAAHLDLVLPRDGRVEHASHLAPSCLAASCCRARAPLGRLSCRWSWWAGRRRRWELSSMTWYEGMRGRGAGGAGGEGGTGGGPTGGVPRTR